MREYFEAELRLLREAATEFAESYPEQASLLNMHNVQDQDPHVERLLEGSAFLTALIRRKMDDQIPEISELLLQQLSPALLRPVPAFCVAQFKPRVETQQKITILAKDTRLCSAPVGEDSTCVQFATTVDLPLYPLKISDITLNDARGRSVLMLHIQAFPGVNLNQLEWGCLPLYLHGELYSTLELLLALAEDLQTIRVVHILGGIEQILAPSLQLETAYQQGQQALMPGAGRDVQGFHILQEFFAFPEKKNFMRLSGLETITWPEGCSEFSIKIEFNRVLPQDLHINKESVQLHCVPALNLFASGCEPITVDNARMEYALVVNHDHLQGVQAFSIERIEGKKEGSKDRYYYHSFQSFQHLEKQNNVGYYHLRRQQYGAHNGQLAVFLAGPPAFHKQTLSCDVTACNGDYPHRFIKINGLQLENKEQAQSYTGTNITRPTRMLHPPQRADHQWQLVAHLALNYNVLTQSQELQDLLNLYNWTGRIEIERKILALKNLALSTSQSLQQGRLFHCLNVEIMLYEGAFQSQAELYQWGCVLHQFFSGYRPLNYLLQTKVICQPSMQEWVWTLSAPKP